MLHTLRTVDPEKARNFFTDALRFSTGPLDVDKMRVDNPDNINVVDVRAEKDFGDGHVPGAHSLPEKEWGTQRGMCMDRTNVIYCYSGNCLLARRAALYFAERGFPVMEMLGGFRGWKEEKLPVETGGLALPLVDNGLAENKKAPERTAPEL